MKSQSIKGDAGTKHSSDESIESPLNAQSSRLNLDLFKKVRERIATIPESYDQDTWCQSSGKSPCGTVACLAGETIICAAPTVEEGIEELKRLYRKSNYSVAGRAAELLNLEGVYDPDSDSSFDETQIFLPDADGWPDPYKEDFWMAKGPQEKAAVAVAFLDHVIETGKVLE